MDKDVKIVNLEDEALRLYKAWSYTIISLRGDISNLIKRYEEDKLKFIASGVRNGWYGNDDVAKVILGSLWDDVSKEVNLQRKRTIRGFSARGGFDNGYY